MDVTVTVGFTVMKTKTAKGQYISCSRHLVTGGHRAGMDVLGAKNPGKYTDQMQLLWQEPQQDGDLEVSKSAAATANKQSSSRAGSAQQTGCIVERITPPSEPRSYRSVSDLGPNIDKQR